MKFGIGLLIVGSIVSVLGWIFYLQGNSVLGPESSFMYANPEWIFYGLEIFVAGLFFLGIGIIVTIIQRKN